MGPIKGASQVSEVTYGPPYREMDWRISAEPRLTIGEMSGAPEFQFQFIADGTILPDSTIAVLDAGAATLRLYDAQGRHLRTLGGKGDGPGEFRYPWRIKAIHPDTLLVWDSPIRRVAWFHRDAGLVRQLRTDDPESPHEGELLADGSRVIRTLDRTFDARGVQPRSSYRHPGRLIRYGEMDSVVFAEASGEERYRDGEGRNWPILLAHQSLFTVGGEPERVVIGRTGSGDIEIFTKDGDPVLILRYEGDLPRLGSVTTDEVRQWFFGRTALPEEMKARVWNEVPKRNAIPPFAALHLDELGFLWAQEWSLGGLATSAIVFGPGGRALGRAELPKGVRILEIVADQVIGMTQDELGVHRAVVYGLVR